MIIITGACGFIGSNLTKKIVELGEKDIICVDNVYRNYIDNLPVRFILSTDFYRTLKSYKDVKYIFHEGAISSTTEENSLALHTHNVDPTFNLIYHCRDNNLKLQFASSASVYGNLSVDEWQLDDKKLNPLNKYASSKLSCESLLNVVMKYNKDISIQALRYFNVYGNNEEHKDNQASPYCKFDLQFKKDGKIKLFEGSENFLRDFISVDEVIDIKLKCIEEYPSGIYDVGTSSPKSFYDVAKEVLNKHGITKYEDYIEFIPIPENVKDHYQKYSKANMKWLQK